MAFIPMCYMKLHAWAETACIQYGNYVRDRKEDEILFDFLQKQKMSLNSKALRMVLGPTQASTQTVLLFFSSGNVAEEV